MHLAPPNEAGMVTSCQKSAAVGVAPSRSVTKKGQSGAARKPENPARSSDRGNTPAYCSRIRRDRQHKSSETYGPDYEGSTECRKNIQIAGRKL